MKDMSKIQIFSGSWLKVIAMVTMLFDHMAVFLPYFHEYPTLYFAMRTIGRTAFIIFAFLLAEGFIHTHNRRKYGRNLTIFALISQLPYSLIHNDFLLTLTPNIPIVRRFLHDSAQLHCGAGVRLCCVESL